MTATRKGYARLAIAALACVVLLNAVLALIGALLPSPSGPPSSSYATAPRGIAALAELLEDSGHPVRRLRSLPGKARLDPAGTVVVLDPDLLRPEEARELRRFVVDGGRLVAGGREPDAWLKALLGSGRGWRRRSSRTWRPAAPVGAVEGVGRVRTAGEGAWEARGAGLEALVANDGSSLLVSAGLGEGQLLLLADASPVQNRLLGHTDNAALALALAGQRGRQVHFMEAVHGYGAARGLRALPGAWQVALAGLLLAGLVLVASRARRLGTPDVPARALPPARRAYVEALATALGRTGDSAGTAAPLQEAARDRLRLRFRLPADAGAGDLRSAAQRAGLTPHEAAAIVEPARGDDDLVAAGRALARLSRGRRPAE